MPEKEKDLDNLFQDLEESIMRLRNGRYEDYFLENYPEQWAALSKEEKLIKIENLKAFFEKAENKVKLRKLKERAEHLRATEFNMGFLFLGVILGISGNLVANLLDRYFVKYGFIYDIGLTLLFFLALWYLERTFIRKERNDLENNATVNELLNIANSFKNKS